MDNENLQKRREKVIKNKLCINCDLYRVYFLCIQWARKFNFKDLLSQISSLF